MSLISPRLWIVATPLGNPGDLSPRAGEILSGADAVLAEDTRRAGLLFKRLGIVAKKFLSFHEHNEQARIPQVLGMLEQGLCVALVSDEGSPLISDPGYRLVRACRDAGFDVSPVPGPSAPTAALSACGLPPYPYVFLGFLPRRAGDVKRALEPYRDIGVTVVFFERKDRLSGTLAVACEVLGPREVCIARELTKDYEQFILTALDAPALPETGLLGEITVVVGPPGEVRADSKDTVLRAAAEEAEAGNKPRETAKRVAARVRGWTAKQVYELISGRKKSGPAK